MTAAPPEVVADVTARLDAIRNRWVNHDPAPGEACLIKGVNERPLADCSVGWIYAHGYPGCISSGLNDSCGTYAELRSKVFALLGVPDPEAPKEGA